MTLSFLRRKDLWVLTGASILLLALIIYTLNFEPGEKDFIMNLTMIWLGGSLLLIFIFNYLLNRLLNIYLDWKAYAGIRFFLQMITGTLLSLLAINLIFNLVRDKFTTAPPDTAQMILLNIYGFAIILPFFSLFFGYKFLRAWRKSEIESEQLQKENVRSQMMNLRNHLDPHFLFNNLNILSSLIDKDATLSKAYLDKFAEVYRIILKTEFADLTTVEDEIALVDSYIYLLKIRFDKAVFVELNISTEHMKMAIPPLTIQMLIENATKHNITSREKPVYIKINSVENNRIEIVNNYQPKKYMEKESEGTGLENISTRYSFFTNEEVMIECDDLEFKVAIPLLEIEYS